jgi:hypothetical protein
LIDGARRLRTLCAASLKTPSAACPVRAQRRTHRAPARAKQLSRMPGTKTTEEVLDDQITICD